MSEAEIERLVAAQIGALMGVAALVRATVRYVKPHGALGNLAADNRGVSVSIARATRAISQDLALHTGLMPTLEGSSIRLEAHSICVHGDSLGALVMARTIRERLAASDIGFKPFIPPSR
jgi:lactam utilization protein B